MPSLIPTPVSSNAFNKTLTGTTPVGIGVQNSTGLVAIPLSSDAVAEGETLASCLLKWPTASAPIPGGEVSLYPCVREDISIFTLPATTTEETFAQVNIYGSKGFYKRTRVSNRFDELRPLWKQCPDVSYNDGPEYEGATSSDPLYRYIFRWQVQLIDGWLWYGRTDQTQQQVPLALISSLIVSDKVSIGFDTNSRACFAYEVAASITISRYVAGTPTNYTFVGRCPTLFFNGELRYEGALKDLVCYYLNGWSICARYQRDNFLTEYVIVVNSTATDLIFSRVVNNYQSCTEFLFARRNCSLLLFVSGLYNIWPTFLSDTCTATAIWEADGSYDTIQVLANSLDLATVFAAFELDGDYQSTIVLVFQSDTLTATSSFVTDGDYALTIISVPNSIDTVTALASFEVDGDYIFTVISGANYLDSTNATAAFNTDGDYAP